MDITPHILDEFSVNSVQPNIKFSYLQRGVETIKILSNDGVTITLAILDDQNNEIKELTYPVDHEIYVVS